MRSAVNNRMLNVFLQVNQSDHDDANAKPKRREVACFAIAEKVTKKDESRAATQKKPQCDYPTCDGSSSQCHCIRWFPRLRQSKDFRLPCRQK